MLLSLVLLALLLLSACTYCVLRHYDIIPSLWEILVGEGEPPEEDDKNGKEKPRPLILSSDRPLSQPDSGTPEAVSREETGSAVPGNSFSRSEDDDRDIPHSWVDGYGPVLSPDTAAYSLAEEVHFETEYVTGILEDAVYAEGNLKVSFLIQAREGPSPSWRPGISRISATWRCCRTFAVSTRRTCSSPTQSAPLRTTRDQTISGPALSFPA